MRIVTYNCNGIRAVLQKDKNGDRDTTNPHTLRDIISTYDPDILCLQETKCPEDFVADLPFEYHSTLAATTKKGYSGVAIYSKIQPLKILKDFEYNEEGRVVCFEYESFYMLNTYTPNSKPDLSRLAYRVNVWEPTIRTYINKLQKKKPVIYCSDFNVAPTSLDIYSEKGKERSHGYTIEERNAFGRLLDECKVVNAFRFIHPEARKYSWFSYFGKAREQNKGWLIDGFVVSNRIKEKIKDCDILSEYKASDHRPMILDVDI